MTKKIILASGNKGKLKEFSELFARYDTEIIPQSEFFVSDVEETGQTFVENAILKARHASQISGLPAIADDSGLVVSALGGAPGIYSARYANEHGNDKANCELLLENMQEHENKKAKFLCVLVYMQQANDPSPIICQGEWEGCIAQEMHGDGGFGYDPLFYVPEYEVTAAQLEKEIKNKISHRAKALTQLMKHLKP